MHLFKSHRLIMLVVAIAAATICSAAYLGVLRSAERGISLSEESFIPTPVDLPTHSASAMDDTGTTTMRKESRDPSVIRKTHADHSRVDRNPIVAVLPPSLIAAARTTKWDEQTSATLELFLVAMFDADGNGMLDDVERIIAVRSLRDAVWPPTPNAAFENLPETNDETQQEVAAIAVLTAEDRRVHHDVDEARRHDRQEGVSVSTIDSDLRAEIMSRFQTDDDGNLTADEFSRYMVHRNAGSQVADLNGDGHVDDADLRIFLDIASPIE